MTTVGLVEQAQRGDHEAFEALARGAYDPPVCDRSPDSPRR